MALITSPTVCMDESPWSVAVLPVELVRLTVLWATPAPPLSDDSCVFIETICRCMSPLLTAVTAPLTAMPSFVAVLSLSPESLATIMLFFVRAGCVDQLDAVGGGVDLGFDADARLVDRVDHIAERLGTGEVHRGRGAAAVGQINRAKLAIALAAVEARKQRALQAAEDGVARDRVAAGGRVQAEVVKGLRAVQGGKLKCAALLLFVRSVTTKL